MKQSAMIAARDTNQNVPVIASSFLKFRIVHSRVAVKATYAAMIRIKSKKHFKYENPMEKCALSINANLNLHFILAGTALIIHCIFANTPYGQTFANNPGKMATDSRRRRPFDRDSDEFQNNRQSARVAVIALARIGTNPR
jgi:hypothetical protein